MTTLAIVDTNVVVAGLLTKEPASPTAWILDDMIRGGIVFVVSMALVAEYRTVLLRPRIREKHGLSPDQVDDLLTALVANAVVREGKAAPADSRNPGDQHLWDLIAAVPDAILVTGDLALTDQAPAAASVASPRAWVEARLD